MKKYELELDANTRVVLADSLNWIVQTRKQNKKTGEWHWDINSTRYYPNLQFLALGLLRHRIKSKVLDANSLLEAIKSAERSVVEEVQRLIKDYSSK